MPGVRLGSTTRIWSAPTPKRRSARRRACVGRQFERRTQRVEHDEVVARALHLGEVQSHRRDYGECRVLLRPAWAASAGSAVHRRLARRPRLEALVHPQVLRRVARGSRSRSTRSCAARRLRRRRSASRSTAAGSARGSPGRRAASRPPPAAPPSSATAPCATAPAAWPPARRRRARRRRRAAPKSMSGRLKKACPRLMARTSGSALSWREKISALAEAQPAAAHRGVEHRVALRLVDRRHRARLEQLRGHAGHVQRHEVRHQPHHRPLAALGQRARRLRHGSAAAAAPGWRTRAGRARAGCGPATGSARAPAPRCSAGDSSGRHSATLRRATSRRPRPSACSSTAEPRPSAASSGSGSQCSSHTTASSSARGQRHACTAPRPARRGCL